jgi:endonuclease/exonuclease/phosphatase family metal-dependent hydrolase
MKLFKMLFPFLLALAVAGCPAPAPVRPTPPPAPPPPPPKKEAVMQNAVLIASINLAKHQGRIEKDEIKKLASVLQRDSIDILAVEGITRYPDLHDRIDFMNALTSASGMRSSFGETMTLSGRQSGNAVFSGYPIRSTENTQYERLHSTRFEAAFQAVVDCGARDLVVVSTLLPDNASLEDQSSAVTQLGTFKTVYTGQPVVIAGNLPSSDQLRSIALYNDAEPLPDKTASRIWFSGSDAFRLIGTRIEKTPFGTLTIVRFGMFSTVAR